jgi:hypothetical protein
MSDNDYYNRDLHDRVADIINSNNEKPTIVNPNSNFVIITYWWGRGNINRNTSRPCPTEENPLIIPLKITKQPIKYDVMIKKWKRACIRANCNYLAIEYPDFAVRGGYQLAINAKPLFIKKALELCDGRAVVYIDGDMIVHKYPSIFDIKDYDFMARHWNIDPRSTRHYNKLACFDLTTFETSGGIMYFNNTHNSHLLLNKWISYTFNKSLEGKADDRIISIIITGNKKFMFNIKMMFLPVEFLWLTDKYIEYLNSTNYSDYMRKKGFRLPSNYDPKDDIIIEHPECLTLEEMAADQGAADNRAPRLYESIVSRRIECSKYGGYFWEYIFFENKNQLNSFQPYLRYIRTVSIEDIYVDVEEEGEDELIKSPYTIIKYTDKYGDRFQEIVNKNIESIAVIKRILNDDIMKLNKNKIKVIYKSNPDGSNDIYINIKKNKIYSNKIPSLILTLFSLNKQVIFIPNDETIDENNNYIRNINRLLRNNNELELIFSNEFYYLNIDKIKINDTPMFFKPSRILTHLLRLVNPELPFIEAFQKAFKSSQLFSFSISIGLYNITSIVSSRKSKSSSLQSDDIKKRKQLFTKFRFKSFINDTT